MTDPQKTGVRLASKDRRHWYEELARIENELGLASGFKMLFGPWSTLETAKIVFLSLKPGRAPDEAELRLVSDERGNSYRVERQTTRSPITEQFLAMATFLGTAPDCILTGVAAPFRADAWEDLDKHQRAASLQIGRRFWSKPLADSRRRLIIAVSNEAARFACELTGAKMECEISAGWSNVKLRRYRTLDDRIVVQLPHLSRFRLFGRPESEAALQAIFNLENEWRTHPPPRLATGSLLPAPPAEANSIPQNTTRAAIDALPAETADFFLALLDHEDFDCDALRMQMTIQFRGKKLGGLNRRLSEWYVSKIFVRDHGGPGPLERRGFKRIDKAPSHSYWALKRPDAVHAFREAIYEMTGVSLFK